MEGEGSQIGSGAGEQPSGPLRGSIVSSACQSCKKKKAKCDGGPPPCTPCRKRQTSCVFAPELDQRRRLAKRTRVEEAQFTQRLAEGLILKIKNSDDGQLAELVNTIRSGASVKEIARYIQKDENSAGISSTPESSDASQPILKSHRPDHAVENIRDNVPWQHRGSHSPQRSRRHRTRESGGSASPQIESPSMASYRRRLMSIEELVEANPLYDVPARPWTTQTVSDNLFSHLISLFLAWWNPYWNLLVEEGFISALKLRESTHPLCSPFLVNAILAVASQLSDSPVVCTRVDEPISRGENFHDEAQSLWVEERCKPSLVNMQALFILWADSKMRGRDELAWSLLEQLITMHNQLSLSCQLPDSFSTTNPILRKQVSSDHVRQSFCLIAWASYNLVTGIALVTQRPMVLDAPSFGLPFSDEQSIVTRSWCAYPRRDRIAIPQNAITNVNCDLAIRCAQINKLLFRGKGGLDSSPSRAALLSLVEHLEDWCESLPKELQPGRATFPAIAELHGMFYALLISAQELVTPSDGTVPRSPKTRDAQIAPPDRTIEHIRDMMPILTDYRDIYGYAATPYAMTQAAALGSFALLRHLDSVENRQMFAELCTCLVAVGRRYAGWKDAVFRLQSTAKRMSIELPSEVRQQFAEFENFFGAPNRQERLDTMYPHFARAMQSASSSS